MLRESNLSHVEAKTKALSTRPISHLGPYVKKMAPSSSLKPGKPARNRGISSNVKFSRKSPQYERFGETIRYLTTEEWQQFLDVIDDYRHKLMMRMIYELGCRVGEFVRATYIGSRGHAHRIGETRSLMRCK